MRRMNKIACYVISRLPRKIKLIAHQSKYWIGYDLKRREMRNPYRDLTHHNAGSEYCLGIFKEAAQHHRHYVAACMEMNVSFCVIDLLANNWRKQIEQSKCEGFLVWPTNCDTVLKSVYDDRIRILEEEMGEVVFPTAKEIWLTEQKARLRDWMDANGIAHPKTKVFYTKSEADAYSLESAYPVVVKTATGASGSGVNIVKNRKAFQSIIKAVFSRGIVPRGYSPYDRQRNMLYVQEYLADVQEWRMVRVGDSFFGYRKEKGKSGMHSASHEWSWLDPGEKLLNLVYEITEIVPAESMDVDVFMKPDGTCLINELQTVFGCTTPAEQMKINGVEGRYVRNGDSWVFEPGAFCQNHMCNLRVQALLDQLKRL